MLIPNQPSRFTTTYKQNGIVETNQYDNKGNYNCVQDAYLASTIIYTLDSLNRVIQIDYWCKKNNPHTHVAREIIYYDNAESTQKRINSSSIDTVPTQLRFLEHPYYIFNFNL